MTNLNRVTQSALDDDNSLLKDSSDAINIVADNSSSDHYSLDYDGNDASNNGEESKLSQLNNANKPSGNTMLIDNGGEKR